MHMVIRAIVYADNKESALHEAERVFEGLCKSDFDYFTTFEKESESSCSGTSRWGKFGNKKRTTGVFELKPETIEKLKKANFYKEVKLNQEGEEQEVAYGLVHQGLFYHWSNFNEALKEIKKELKKRSIQELFEREQSMFRYRCHCAGQYIGSEIHLYDSDGEGVRDREHLINALDKWDNPEHKHEKIYVVPADVHY